MPCSDVGSTNSDISGLGIIISFAVQGAISIAFSTWSRYLRDVAFGKVPPGPQDRLKQLRIEEIVTSASDIQILNGISLLIAALAQHRTLDLYHFHIVYDTVSFTGISFCATIIIVFKDAQGRRTSRFLAIAVFCILYLTFVIIFGVKLGRWNEAVPGACYNTRLIALAGSSHPLVDKIYLGITSFYFLSILIVAMGHSEGRGIKDSTQRGHVVNIAFLQYPLHLYTVIAMRISNASLLSGDSEDSWGFGQIVALVLLGATILQIIRGYDDYRRERKAEKKDDGPEGKIPRHNTV